MTVDDMLKTLEGYGSEQTRKIYRRHGVGENQFGVSYANLKTLKKKVKTDHEAAQQLWATGNHDARVFAAMIADPEKADAALLDAWAADLDNYVITDAFSGFAGKTALAREKAAQWAVSDGEWTGQGGWNILAYQALNEGDLPDAYFEPYLTIVARDIHGRANRVRYAMNNALIAIGSRNDTLAEKAVAVAEEVGAVDVDHGETNCKTPDAAAYIRKARARRRARERA